MKKILFVIISLAASLCLYADDYTPPFPLTKGTPIYGNTDGGSGSGNGTTPPPGLGNEDDDEGKGHRSPARPAYCTIDFDAAEVYITGFDSADIETFEIRDADAVNCIFATDDCGEFVAELASTNAPVYVIFYFDGFTLSGYFAR